MEEDGEGCGCWFVAAHAGVGEVGGGNGGENGGVTAVWMPSSVGDQSEVGQCVFSG